MEMVAGESDGPMKRLSNPGARDTRIPVEPPGTPIEGGPHAVFNFPEDSEERAEFMERLRRIRHAERNLDNVLAGRGNQQR
jgi:hypothetical protein